MLIDEIDVNVKAGDGGEGKISFGKLEKSGPDGGNGGKGGDIYIVGSSDLTLLSQFRGKSLVEAQNGIPGGKDKCAGKNGKDLIIMLPVGSLVEDRKTKEVIELENVDQKILLCVGGKGGIGNFDLRSSRNTTPKITKPAKKGQKRKLYISLRFIADFGLIGLPSVGKSSLLNELTNTQVKTAPYHFTTLSANLGVLPNKKIIADIPGLIEGASQGKGLGTKFLKHIQKVDLLLHCISSDSKDHIKDYEIVRKEIGSFSHGLLDKKELIVLTKHDLVDEKRLNKIKTELKTLKKEIIVTSVFDPKSIKNILTILK